MAAPTIGKLSSMYMYAWKAGLKTTYYLRSRPATRIQQATVAATPEAGRRKGTSPVPCGTDRRSPSDEAIACSLENPESCEACQ